MREKSRSRTSFTGSPKTNNEIRHKYFLRSTSQLGAGDFSLIPKNDSNMAPRRQYVTEGCNTANMGTYNCQQKSNLRRNFTTIVKIGLALVLFGILICYVSEHKFAVIRTDLSDMRTHLRSMQHNIKDLNNVGTKKSDIEKQLTDIASTLPMLKEMAADLRDGIKGLDPCPAGIERGDVDSLRSVVKEELEHFNADKTGRTDFALESSGGTILSTRNTVLHEGNGATLSLFGIPLCSTESSARALIQAGVMPGECWAFKGSTGVAVIKLVSKIYVTGFSVEHISQAISPTGEVSTAPKDFALFGLQSASENDGFFFGQYRYNIYGRSVQYFPVIHKSNRQFEIIEFKVLSNHGHPDYTCIYRLRVHGDLTKKDL